MMLALFLPTVLRAAGLTVVEHADWRTRHHGEFAGPIKGILGHHTGSTADSAVDVVYRGRSGLAGPLAQLAVDRDGTWHVISAGQAWHAGTGGPLADIPQDQGNAWLLGIEGVSAGTAAGDWTAAQRVSYPVGVAALLAYLQLGPDRFWFHKTWAPGRKVDIAGWPGDLTGFRGAVARQLNPPVEDDLPTPKDVWDYQIPDPFVAPGQPGWTKPAGLLVGWAATHAAYARTEATAAKAAVAALAKQVATGDLSEAAVLASIDAHVQEALAALPKAGDSPGA